MALDDNAIKAVVYKTSSFPNRERKVSIGRLLVACLINRSSIRRPMEATVTRFFSWDFKGAALGYS